MSDTINISLAPHEVFEVASLKFTQGHMMLFLVTLIILFVGVYTSKVVSLRPGRFQTVLEFIIGWFLERTELSFSKKESARRVFPLVMTMFIIIFLSNVLGVLPFIEQLKFGEHHLFRAPSADLNMNLSLALFSVILGNIIAFVKYPWVHFNHYLNINAFIKVRSFADFMRACLDFFISLIEIISEIAKVISVSFRLFGNKFAGIAIAAVFAFLAPYVIPIPFYILELFMGIIQAIVFPLLTLYYISGPLHNAELHSEHN